jgi:hypothetical protein
MKHTRDLPTGGAAFAGGSVAFVVFLVGLVRETDSFRPLRANDSV